MDTVFGSGLFLTDALLGPALGAAAPRPLVTHYDDATGERTELSGTTTANWTAKAANLLRDEVDVEPGTRVAALLPAHWQTVAALLAVWSCGAELVGNPAGADVVLADAARLDVALAAARARSSRSRWTSSAAAWATWPAGPSTSRPRSGRTATSSSPGTPVDGAAPAWDGASGEQVLATARERADALGITAGGPGAVGHRLGQRGRPARRAARRSRGGGVAGSDGEPGRRPRRPGPAAETERVTLRLGERRPRPGVMTRWSTVTPSVSARDGRRRGGPAPRRHRPDPRCSSTPACPTRSAARSGSSARTSSRSARTRSAAPTT